MAVTISEMDPGCEARILRKALAVVINKVDRPDAQPEQSLSDIYDLFIDLDASENQLDFPYLFAVGRDGVAKKSPQEAGANLHLLLDMILDEIPDTSVHIAHFHETKRVASASVLAALQANPGLSTRELVPHVYRDVPEKLYRLAERSLLAHLEKLLEFHLI